MALELHSHSQRYAFLDYRDLQRDCRLNLSEMRELGTITLFVADILQLSSAEQEVLRRPFGVRVFGPLARCAGFAADGFKFTHHGSP